ncbi:MAG TPA: hypothetical protein VKZ72_05390 [Acidimicrobiales bacterium]|nr:hypothetical protein [Acidimicrobiales bacterium]
MMFEVHCHEHGSSVLLDMSRVEGIWTSPEGPVLDWQCWCGARGRLVAGTRSEPREAAGPVVELDAHRPGAGDADVTPVAS